MEDKSNSAPALVDLSEAQRCQAMNRFAVLRPYLEGDAPLARTARDAGVPIRTVERWLTRYRRDGLAGLTRRVRRDVGTHRLPPDLVTLIGDRAYVPVGLSQAAALARVLGARRATELGPYEIVSSATPAELGGVSYLRHEPLIVLDADGNEAVVSWRLVDGQIHASGIEGLGKALAWRENRWEDRENYVARFREPEDIALHEAEQDMQDS